MWLRLWSPLVFVALLVGSACSPFGGGNEDELREQARSFVPRNSRVVKEEPGACVELAAFPSCFEVTYRNNLSEHDQERLIRNAAEDDGWELTDAEAKTESTWLWFEKGDFLEDPVRVTVRVYDEGGSVQVID